MQVEEKDSLHQVVDRQRKMIRSFCIKGGELLEAISDIYGDDMPISLKGFYRLMEKLVEEGLQCDGLPNVSSKDSDQLLTVGRIEIKDSNMPMDDRALRRALDQFPGAGDWCG